MGDRMDGVDELLEGVELTAPWMDALPGKCMFCGAEMETSPGRYTPNVGEYRCPECGFGGVLSAPESMVDERYADDFSEVGLSGFGDDGDGV